jgi:hypothetical protein
MRSSFVAIGKWLVRLLFKADPKLAKVRELMAEIEANDISGERKRSWVLNNLRTLFPDTPPRDLALLIELVMQELV